MSSKKEENKNNNKNTNRDMSYLKSNLTVRRS